MDDRTWGPSDGSGPGPGAGRHATPEGGPGRDRGDDFGQRRSRGDASDFDFDALARSLAGDEQSSVSVPLVVGGGVLVAMIVFSFVYGWPLWAKALCALALLALLGLGLFRRPPVAPLELTSSERDRVCRVLDEHGARPAVALVRALYPGESPVAAAKTVRLLLERR